tara:strand:+ start:941 stop:1816 length:876 start_codon:yes stop_codon:yes gene_type:complete
MIKYPDLNRIDFNDYLKSYPDLRQEFGNNVNMAKRHWIINGRFEGRFVKLNNINYKYIKHYITETYHSHHNKTSVNILTSLYVDKNPLRAKEYKLALQLNLKNPHVNHVYVFWDNPGDGTGIGHFLPKHEKLTIIPHRGRPSFKTLFELCNSRADSKLWCVCNGDIVITDDIHKLQSINMNNKLLALTRWEFISETDISIFHEHERPNKYSQDTWCFKSPILVPSELELIRMGEVACDSKLSDVYKHYQREIYNPCMDIKTLHMHMQNSRTQSYDVVNAGFVENCLLQDII